MLEHAIIENTYESTTPQTPHDWIFDCWQAYERAMLLDYYGVLMQGMTRASGEVDPSVHITRIGDLDHAVELLKMVKAQQIDRKAIVYPHRWTGEIKSVQAWTAADEQDYLSTQG